MTDSNNPIHVAAIIGQLNTDEGGAQQLLFDVFSRLPADEFDRTVYHMFGDGTYRNAFEDAGVHVVDLNAAGNFDARTFVRFVRQLHQNSPDILHTNSPISGLWGRPAARLAGVKHIVSVEHNVHDGYPLKHRLANGLSLPLADRVVGVTQAVTESVAQWEQIGLADDALLTIPNGIDIERFATTTTNGDINTPTDTPLIGTLGTHSKQKGFDTLVRALSRLDKAHATIIGSGPAHDDLRELAGRFNLNTRVTFPGRVPAVPPYLDAFDIAVFPSRWEGFGLVVGEAMAAETPVIATDIPAFQEVVGDAGVLVPPEDPAALADAIKGLLDDPSRRAELARRGHNRVRERFGIERVASEYAALYRNLTDRALPQKSTTPGQTP